MIIGDNSIIGANTRLYGPCKIPSCTLLINGFQYPKNQGSDMNHLDHSNHLDYLHSILPKCHETYC